jgi:hypothetical protein
MKQKKSKGIAFYFKLVLGLICAVLGLKLFLAVASTITVGLTVFSLAMWGLGALAVGGGILFLILKMANSKKKR